MRSGIVLFDKPPGHTSHDLVARTRRLAGTRKVGHAGTLDPMATGLMLLGLNSSTRLLTYLVGLDKVYLATIRLGSTTVSDDAEGELLETADPAVLAAVTDEAIRAAVVPLTGAIEQVPSTVSAIKIDGRRAYARARAGEDVVIPARAVTVSAFEVLGVSRETDGAIDVSVRVACSSGTYIRALARDLGASLGVGGHLTTLRRTRVGPFDVADAATLETVDIDRDLMTPTAVATLLLDSVRLDAQEAIDLGNGKRVTCDAERIVPVAGGSIDDVDESGRPARTGVIAALSPSDALIGLAELRGGSLRTVVNFPADEVAS